MILIADCHASVRHGNEAEFVQMLARVAQTGHDVVFLGDILDFWIALPRYEQDLHRLFLRWCQEESRRRLVGFVEGNHEFFLAHSHRAAFTFCAADEHVDAQGRLFVHGDTVNQADRAYLRFRRWVKSDTLRWLEVVAPPGPAIARFIKRHMEARERCRPKAFPAEQVDAFARRWFARGVRAIYLGHFHDPHLQEAAEGRVVQVIPAWHGSGLVGVLAEGTAKAALCPWRELQARPSP